MSQLERSKSSIMIVDDEEKYIEDLKQILEPFGFDLYPLNSGAAVFDLLEAAKPDIILLDVVMPQMDGFEVCRRLKQIDMARHIPIIFMFSLTETVDIVTGLELGAADYISKPFQKEEVLNRIKTHFVMRQLQSQLEKTKQSLDDAVSMKTQELTRSNEQLKRELAEHRRMENILKQARKMEAVSTLSSGIAHDFNNILSIIVGYTEMAALETLSESSVVGDCLKQINAAAFRARELVQHLLTFCRQTEQEKTLIKVSPILKYVLNYIKDDLAPGIQVKKEIAEETGMVLADPTLIHQALLNLCRNAAQAMVDTGGILEVTLEQVLLEPGEVTDFPNMVSGHHIRILVKDTGPGMDADIRERIFDPYFTTKEPGEGTGLGLSVAHGIAVSHGGTILVKSDPGSGSSFELLLPCRQTERRRSPLKENNALPKGQGKVLYVDDEEALIDFGTTVLQRAGYNVEGCTGSLEALAVFEKDPDSFDLVVTDHIMPKMQGMELAGKLLEIRADIPVLLCTGTKSEELIEQAQEVGILKVLQKPIPMNTLIKTINAVLGVTES